VKEALKTVSLSILSFALCVGLFIQMTFLISGKNNFESSMKQEPIMLFSSSSSRKATTKKRSLPKKPILKSTPTKNLAKSKIETPNKAAQPTMAMKFDMPALQFGTGVGVASGEGGSTTSGSSEAMAIVKIEPQMPRAARARGIEGYVVLDYSINTSGNVENISIVQSKPRRIFDGAAKQALVRWKFRPKKIEGKAVAQKNLKVKFDFKIRD
jgi:protein TonB